MWLFLALLGAFAKGLMNLFHKKVSDVIDADVFAWITITLSLPVIGIIVLINGAAVIPLITEWPLYMLATSVMSVAALMFSVRALRKEQISYISPLYAFIPIYTLIIAWTFLDEVPPASGLIGVAIIFVGAYVINLKSKQIKWYDPLAHVLKNSGARYALTVGLLFAILGVIIKYLTTNGDVSPLAWMFVNSTGSWILLLHVPLRKSKQLKTAFKNHSRLLVNSTVTNIAASLFGIYSVVLTEFTAYALSVRRLEIMFSIILGWKILGDTNIKNKLIGGGLMTAGVIVVSIF